MATYTSHEYVDMIKCYALRGNNAREAARMYAELYPTRRSHPNHKTIGRLMMRVTETGSVLPSTTKERDHPVADANEDDVLREIRRDPQTSVSRIADTVRVAPSTVHKILRSNGMHPYHFRRSQALRKKI